MIPIREDRPPGFLNESISTENKVNQLFPGPIYEGPITAVTDRLNQFQQIKDSLDHLSFSPFQNNLEKNFSVSYRHQLYFLYNSFSMIIKFFWSFP